MDVVRIAMLAVCGVLIGLWVRGWKPEYAVCMGIVVSLLIFFQVCGYLEGVKDALGQLGGLLGDSSAFLGILMKVTGITYLCEFCSGLCRDAGYSYVAAQLELFGKVTVLLAGMPVLLSLVDLITGFAG